MGTVRAKRRRQATSSISGGSAFGHWPDFQRTSTWNSSCTNPLDGYMKLTHGKGEVLSSAQCAKNRDVFICSNSQGPAFARGRLDAYKMSGTIGSRAPT